MAHNRNVVLIAPEFSKESFPEYVYLMMSTERGKLLRDESLFLTDSLGLIFDFFKLPKFNLLKTTTKELIPQKVFSF